MGQLQFDEQVAATRAQLCRIFLETGFLDAELLRRLKLYVAQRKSGKGLPALPLPACSRWLRRKTAQRDQFGQFVKSNSHATAVSAVPDWRPKRRRQQFPYDAKEYPL